MMLNRLMGCATLGLWLVSASPAAAELNVRQVAPGVYTGSAPDSAADYRCLQRLGIRTVIDSRPFRPRASRRERREVSRLGMTHLRVPIDYHPADDHGPHRVLAQLSEPRRQPVYLHCQLGRDRTSLVVALYRVRYQGWTPEAAYAEMERRQFNPLLLALDRYFWQHVSAAESLQPCCSASSSGAVTLQ